MTSTIRGAPLLGALIEELQGEGFETLLDQWVSACLPIDNVTILAYFSNRRPKVLYANAKMPEVHARLETDYVSGAYLVDPFFSLFDESAPAGCHRLRDVAPDQFQRSEYFLRYYHRTTVIDEVAFVTYPSTGTSVHLCVGRDAASGRQFSAGELATLRGMSPVLRALMNRNWASLLGEPRQVNWEKDLPGKLAKSMVLAHGIQLSPRQSEVALHILRGHSSVSIGLRLGLSSQTVKVFRKQLYKRCNISSQAELFSLMLPLLEQIGY